MTMTAQNAMHAGNILRNTKAARSLTSLVSQDELFGIPTTLPNFYDSLNLSKIGRHIAVDSFQNNAFILCMDVRGEDIPSSSAITTLMRERIACYTPPAHNISPYLFTASLNIFNRLAEHIPLPHDSVFDELQKLRSDETRFRAALSELRLLENIQQRTLIANRLEALLEDFQSDYDRCLDTESLQVFISLLKLTPRLSKPLITATTAGNLVVEWESSDKQHYLALHLLPTSQIQYSAYCPSSKNPQIRKQTSGTTSADELFLDLSAYKILEWVCIE